MHSTGKLTFSERLKRAISEAGFQNQELARMAAGAQKSTRSRGFFVALEIEGAKFLLTSSLSLLKSLHRPDEPGLEMTMDQSEWGGQQQRRDEMGRPPMGAVEARGDWINKRGPVQLLGMLAWQGAEKDLIALCGALAEAGPTLGTGDSRMTHIGNSLAFQALLCMTGSADESATGTFIRSLDAAMDYADTMGIRVSDETFLACMLAFDESLWAAIDEQATYDVRGSK